MKAVAKCNSFFLYIKLASPSDMRLRRAIILDNKLSLQLVLLIILALPMGDLSAELTERAKSAETKPQ